MYRATDTNLKRQVAIKVLPASVAGDPGRLARFQREAEVLAALNHPHIAAIYGLEKTPEFTALVMELVEGDDLSQRVAGGPMPIDEALPIAKQIAEALEAAHEQGIIHRDLKPANIKVRADGTAKVLDFGLAKAMEPVGPAEANASQMPTITTPAMTQAGIILGTAAYMSPEQARGRVVDRRADIWAFGAVLFEMLTGARAFPGEDVAETLANVINKEPASDALPTALPPHVRQTLRLCLTKPLRERVPDIGAVRLALDGAFETATQTASVPTPAESRARVAWLVAATAVVGMTTLAIPAVRYLREAPADEPVLHLSVPLPLQPAFSALSPDGRRLLLRLNSTVARSLVVRSLDSSDLQTLSGGGESRGPFWSADGKSIAFFDQNDRALKTMPAAGGPMQTLCTGTGLGAGGILVYDPSTSIPNSSNQLTWLDRSGKALGNVGELQRQGMVVLAPNGKTAATLKYWRTTASPVTMSLYDLQRGGETRVTSPPLTPSTPVWSPESDLIAFGSGNSLYVKDASGGSPDERLLESRNEVMPSGWSQDGRYLIYTEVDPSGRGDIWYLPDPLNRSGARTPVKFQGTEAIETQGVLSPDGRWLAYTSDESGQFEIYVRPFPSGPGRWKVSAGGVRNHKPQWRRDGKELFFVENAFPNNRLMAVAVQSGPRGEFRAGAPQALFAFRTVGGAPPTTSQRYSPSADGQRFLVQVQPDAPAPTLSVITNWEKAALARHYATRQD